MADKSEVGGAAARRGAKRTVRDERPRLIESFLAGACKAGGEGSSELEFSGVVA